jgi:hypothetical protein
MISDVGRNYTGERRYRCPTTTQNKSMAQFHYEMINRSTIGLSVTKYLSSVKSAIPDFPKTDNVLR